jgi:hypothetical protein
MKGNRIYTMTEAGKKFYIRVQNGEQSVVDFYADEITCLEGLQKIVEARLNELRLEKSE